MMMSSNEAACKSAVPPIPLVNYQSAENVLFDTLHRNANQAESTCHKSVCQGSVLQPKAERTVQGNHKILNTVEAEDFYSQFFSMRKTSESDKAIRWREVMTSIEERNGYDMSVDELEFACKTAWRNASRCIGRIQWSKLMLFDGRKVKSTKEMFDLICKHIEYGTNNGNIRSAITVFPSQQSGTECRIWNSEYISYAGFEVSPGVVIGDPNHVEFTKICLQLGWKPPVTRFQVLPLVLQFGNNNPDLYIIPDSLVLEVHITHPKYPKFGELELKWFAVPAVTNMSLDCGGQIHTAVGFNGWYMSTEIVRDFTDHNRYNLIKDIASSMEMDTSKPALFWKDFAATELNVAVVTSFQAINVTITDHHTASETFMHHMENEQMLRGGCPADWVWITPPLGGSLTPVFHQEMLNYKLKPSYEYQTKPWVGFNWQGVLRKGNVRKERLTLRSVARAFVICSILMKSALRERKHCTILYATETGHSEGCAYKLQRRFDQDFNIELFCMDKYDMTKLRKESLLLIVTSTFGNGEAPDNGKTFEQLLINLASRRNVDTESIVPQYAVFGLGSSAYPDYCAFSKRVDELLAKLGFNRLLELHTGDEQKNQELAFKDWCTKAYSKTCLYFGTQIRSNMDGYIADQSHDYTLSPCIQSVPVIKGLQSIHKKSPSICHVLSVESLVASGADRNTILVKLQHDLLTYDPGDHLAIFPTNDKVKVQKLCHSCLFDEGVTADTPVSITNTANNKYNSNNDVGTRIPAASLFMALTHYLDIEVIPKQCDLEALLPICKCDEKERKKLREISMNADEYNVWAESRPSWVDLITEFDSLRIPAGFLLTELPVLQARFYSISNSPLVYTDQVHLTVGVLEYSLGPSDKKRKKFGLCSNLLENIAEGELLYAYIRRCPGFRLPTSISQDILMIGSGSGLAPFRSFWQHRALSKESGAGPLYLFQGSRTRSHLLHIDEINQAVSDGVIEAQFNALSREEHVTKTYVQDKLLEQAELLQQLLLERKAHVYVCGDIQMSIGVAKIMRSILTASKFTTGQSNGHIMSSSAACEDDADYVSLMKQEGRYHEDIYSILV